MRLVIALLPVALLASGKEALATELYCSGDAFYDSTKVRAEFVATIDEAANKVTMWSPDGEASGDVIKDNALYKGYVFSTSGTSFWYNLSRFTGELILLRQRTDQSPSEAKNVFWGTCQKRQRMF